MRDFGTRAWGGEDALESLDGPHGHAYLAYPALALGMARLARPVVPAGDRRAARRAHRGLRAAACSRRRPASSRRTRARPTRPTSRRSRRRSRCTGARRGSITARVLAHWAERVRAVQIDRASGLVIQRMGAVDGARPRRAARLGHRPRRLLRRLRRSRDRAQLADGLFRHESTFSRVRRDPRVRGRARRTRRRRQRPRGARRVGRRRRASRSRPRAPSATTTRSTRLYRTTDLFGLRVDSGARARFATGGPIGNALLLALLTSGPELAP